MTINELWFDPSLCFINNQWVQPHSGQLIELTNPSTGLPLCNIARGNAKDIDEAVRTANDSLQGPWGKLTAPERGRILYRIGQLVIEKADALAIYKQLAGQDQPRHVKLAATRGMLASAGSGQ